MAESLFSPTASGEAFEGGHSDCGEESHDTNDGKELDEDPDEMGAEYLSKRRENPTSLLIGSMYGGTDFGFAGGRVVSIQVGAFAE